MNAVHTGLKKFYEEHQYDAVLIGNMIEEHNYKVVFDKPSGEFLKVPTKTSYVACKNPDCKLCTRIKELSEGLDEVANARICSRGIEKASIYSVARIATIGLFSEEIAEVLDTTPEEVRAVVAEDIEKGQWSMEEIIRLFKTTFDVPNEVMYDIIPYTPEEVAKELQKASNGKFKFKED